MRRVLSGRRRLGHGELADHRLAQDIARQWFFEAIYEEVPWAYESLAQHVFPFYQAFFREAAGEGGPDGPDDEQFITSAAGRFISFCNTLPGPPPTRGVLEWAKLVASEGLSPSLPPLRAWLYAWAEHFHLTDPWCLDTALCTLFQLQMNEFKGLPEELLMTRFAHPGVSLPVPPGIRVAGLHELETSPDGPGLKSVFQPLNAPYNPYMDTRYEARMRLRPSLGENTEAYLDQVEAACKDASRVRLRAEIQFCWLARYQCLEESRLDIAEEEGLHLSTVATPLAELFPLLGLTPRKDDRGRPPGIREKGGRLRNG